MLSKKLTHISNLFEIIKLCDDATSEQVKMQDLLINFLKKLPVNAIDLFNCFSSLEKTHKNTSLNYDDDYEFDCNCNTNLAKGIAISRKKNNQQGFLFLLGEKDVNELKNSNLVTYPLMVLNLENITRQTKNIYIRLLATHNKDKKIYDIDIDYGYCEYSPFINYETTNF